MIEMGDREDELNSEARFFFNPDLLVNRINCMMRLALIINKLPAQGEHTILLKAAMSELLDSIQMEEMAHRFKLRNKGDADDDTRH
tara:strand:- start:1852 stop:2109 length:258 start_codon:yes stop_codon:yes gene_type:complete